MAQAAAAAAASSAGHGGKETTVQLGSVATAAAAAAPLHVDCTYLGLGDGAACGFWHDKLLLGGTVQQQGHKRGLGKGLQQTDQHQPLEQELAEQQAVGKRGRFEADCKGSMVTKRVPG